MYYIVEPEVAGGWGSNTVADTTTRPPIVSRLHYQFDGWLGDEILESFPCFIVSESLKNDLASSDLTGFEFDDVEISKSNEFLTDDDMRDLPKFYWLKVLNQTLAADFIIAPDRRLMVSDTALAVMGKHRMSHADVFEV